MTSTTVTYLPPIRRAGRASRPDYEALEHAHALAEEGRPAEAIQRVFAHLFPGVAVPELATAPFQFVQGSSRVTVRRDGDDLVITVPLVTLPTDARAVAALRYVLTRVAASGQIYQPVLRGDALALEFHSKLAHLHPAKLLEALRRMPFEADATDDWMISQFGATALDRAPIEPLDAGEVARADASWRTHWAEIEQLLKHSHRRRSVFFLNELTAFARYRIEHVLPLAGALLGRLREAAATFNSSDENPDRREASLARFVKDMKAVTADELARDLGHAEYALSPLDDGTPTKLLGYLGNAGYMDSIGKLRTTGKPIDAALALISTYTYLLATAAWPEAVRAELARGLELASGKPWREAANLLWDHATELASRIDDEDDDEDEDEDEDGDAETAADTDDQGAGDE